MRLRLLTDIPECGIYALIHPKSKRMTLYYTTNIISHLLRTTENIRYGRVRDPHLKKYRKDYEFRVIEELVLPASNQERILQKTLVLDIAARYRDLGYKVSVPFNIPKFKFSIKLNTYIYLYIINKNGNELLLGVFDTKSECTEYVQFLGSPKYVISINELTKKYMKGNIEE